MLFSIHFTSDKITIADEIRCPYNQLGLIYNFAKENPQKRYCVTIPANDFAPDQPEKLREQVTKLKEVAPDYTIRTQHIALLKLLIRDGFQAHLAFPATDWETFSSLLQNKVSDIYIDGPLGFQIEKLAKAKKQNPQLKIRVSPTISPNASMSLRTANTFFIRPEDLSLYEPAIDIIDFKEKDRDKENVLFTIYKRGTFNYELSDLIKDLTPSINNIFIRPDFIAYRLNCGQRCKEPGNRCKLCLSQFDLSNKSTNFLRERNNMKKSAQEKAETGNSEQKGE